MEQAKPNNVVVVGSGVVGSACAYYLAKSGSKVTLLDRNSFCSGCSQANCGLIAISHVLPLSMPGTVQKQFKTVFAKDSPLYIKPTLDWRVWSWMLQFVRNCTEQKMLEVSDARKALLLASDKLYRDLIVEEGWQCEWESVGSLYVFLSQKGFDKYAAVDDLMQKHFDMGARKLDRDELLAVEPSLKPAVAGGWLYEMDSHLRPDRLMDCWRKSLEQLGVSIREQCEMVGINRNGNKASAVVTTSGELEADAFVVATGAETPLLAKVLGYHAPIQPGKGYSITMPRPDHCPKIPLLFQEYKVVATPMQSGYRLGSTMEFTGYDSSKNPKRLQALVQGASHYLRQPSVEPIEEEWCGWRPMTHDGLPRIGSVDRFSNVWLAAGHNMLGLSMAPSTGKLIAELINGEHCHIPPEPYRL